MMMRWRRGLKPLAALLILNATAFLVFTLPRLLQEKTSLARREYLREFVDRQRSEVAQRRARTETLRTNDVELRHFYGEVVSSRRASLRAVLERIESLAQQEGLRVQQHAFSREKVAGTRLTRFGITLPLEGSYRQLVGFLTHIESTPEFLTVDSIQIRDQDRSGRAQLGLALSAYFREEPNLP